MKRLELEAAERRFAAEKEEKECGTRLIVKRRRERLILNVLSLRAKRG